MERLSCTFIEDTILASMETAGVEDMPDDVERKGIGTPATRAAILEKLVSAGFVERKKAKKVTSLIPTQEGCSLITVLPEQLQSPLLTVGEPAETGGAWGAVPGGLHGGHLRHGVGAGGNVRPGPWRRGAVPLQLVPAPGARVMSLRARRAFSVKILPAGSPFGRTTAFLPPRKNPSTGIPPPLC